MHGTNQDMLMRGPKNLKIQVNTVLEKFMWKLALKLIVKVYLSFDVHIVTVHSVLIISLRKSTFTN